MPKEPAAATPAEPAGESAAPAPQASAQQGSAQPIPQEPNQQEPAQQETTQPLLPTRYRFTTQDGQMHESTASPDAIAAAYPGAAITHTVETDQTTGESTLTPYSGEGGVANGQPQEAETQDSESAEQESAEPILPTQESSGTPQAGGASPS